MLEIQSPNADDGAGRRFGARVQVAAAVLAAALAVAVGATWPRAAGADGAAASPGAEKLGGAAIMKRRQATTRGKTEVADLDIRVEEKGGYDRTRRLKRYVARANGLERKLIRFIEPPRFRGLAVLTHEVPDGDDEQWTYLPELRKVKRVPVGERTESFAATGFSFEDFRAEDLKANTYTLLREAKVQDRPAFVVEAKPVKGAVRALRAYAKRIFFIDQERFVALRIDFYDKRGKLLKSQFNWRWHEVGGIYRPDRVVMLEYRRGRTTWVRFRSWEVGVELDEALFTTRELYRALED